MTENQETKNPPRPSMLAVPIPKPKLPKHLMDEPTVTMIFPRKLSLNLDEYMGRVDFDEGLQEVPVSLATEYPVRDHHGKPTGETGAHWYLVQQGVQRYVPAAPPSDDELAAQLKARGFKVEPPVAPEPVEEVAPEPVEEVAPGPVVVEEAPRKRKRG